MKIPVKNIYTVTIIMFILSVLIIPFFSGELISIKQFLTNSLPESNYFILLNIRIPRVLLAVFVGGGLAFAGLMYQSLLQNGLASPYTLGVASGASLGAVIGINMFSSSLIIAKFGILGCAFIGANITILLVYGLSKISGKIHTSYLILGGVAISFFFGSIISATFYFSDYTNTFQMIRWMMGGLEIIGYDNFIIIIPGVIIAISILFIQSKALNIISVSNTFAQSKGVSIKQVQRVVFFTSSLLTALIVSFSGPIAFVGLVSPHIARILLGPDLKRLLLFTFLLGGLILIYADFITRFIFYPLDLPVGVLTGVLGGPFFLWMIFKRGNIQ